MGREERPKQSRTVQAAMHCPLGTVRDCHAALAMTIIFNNKRGLVWL